MSSLDAIKKDFPLHWLVWNNEYRQLEELLGKNEIDKEKPDSRGRTPLMLAVTLGHLESARVLLRHNANVNVENRGGWSVVHEAVSTGDPELLQLVLEQRDFQRHSSRIGGIPALLQRLNEAPDFYVEMKWEFTSWVPLVSRMCPSDTYKVYKKGSNVRIDTTLLGFDQSNSWQRGRRSYIFKGQNDTAMLIEVDHDAKQVCTEQMKVSQLAEDASLATPTEEAVAHRLTTPTVITYIDTEKISFERNKSGIWGWRSDKVESVNGHDCKVFSATNVELVYKMRTEHLPEADKERVKQAARTPLQAFFGVAELEHREAVQETASAEEFHSKGNPCSISAEEYFSEDDLGGRDIGRPKEISTKIQKFKATLWLCESYPLSLPEQIMPIVDLMAISSSHFAKLKDFIQLQLPSGFPVRIEIPVFHVLNARITFGNIFAMDEPVTGVSQVSDNERISCVVDDSCFEVPADYIQLGSEFRRQFTPEEEDELLQFAIEQSLLEAGSEREEVDIWEALRGQRPPVPGANNFRSEEERQLQRAIQESLSLCVPSNDDNLLEGSRREAEENEYMDPDLKMALALSKKEREEEERRQKEEEDMLQRALQLSLTDK